MKKYNYLNKSQKYLLATMTIPLALSVLPTTENVSASEIPTLHVYELNGSPKLEWATEILSDNVLTKTSFESGDEIPILAYKGNATTTTDGQQSISLEDSYTGNYSLKIGRTIGGLGNAVYYPATQSDNSQVMFQKQKRYIEPGKYMSVSMKVKTDSEATLTPFGRGGKADVQLTFQEALKSTKSFQFSQKVEVGQKYFYITNADEFKKLIGKNNYYTVSKKSTIGNYNYLLIKSIDETTGRVELDNPFQESFNINEDVLMHKHINPVVFPSRNVSNTNGWETINFNAYVDGSMYNTMTRGFEFWLETKAAGDIYVDDIVFGYATEVEVYRDGKSIYKGYLSDFHDKSIKDNVKPNKVTSVNGSITNDLNINFNVLKPEDDGVKANYQIESIAENGVRSKLSAPQEIELKTEVTNYKYTINNDINGIPSKEISTSQNISIALKSINLETDYLHIQAIDKNGNASEVESFQLKDLIDMKDLYNKVKELEYSNNYNDFIDFIHELEQLYGDNLPQDLKDRLEQLGKYHGVNTSFLLLEEGDFRLSTMDINSFGHTKLTAKKQTLTTAFKGDFGVIDARGTQEGWNVSVSATPFTVETFDGFVGTPHQLPIGSLALNSVISIEQIGKVHNSQLPTITLNQYTAIDGQNTTINLLNADKQKGMGEFQFTFGPDALALTVDAVTAKIDTVNYPDKNTPYASTVTWDLVSGPQI